LKPAACRTALLFLTLILLHIDPVASETRAAAFPRLTGAELDVAALMEAAQHQFGTGNYTAAISTLQSVVSQSPSNGAAFYWLSRCYYEMHDFDGAVAQAEKSVGIEPKNSVYLDWLGRAYGGKADHDRSFFVARKVKKQFEAAIQADPTNVTARKDLEQYCLEAPSIVGGSTDEAHAQLDPIAAIDAVEGHLARAMFDLEALKKPELAEAEYRQVLAGKPQKPEPYFEVASFFQNQNKIADMKAAVEGAAEVKPNDPRLEFYRAVVLILSNADLPRAEQYLKSYLASTPDRSDWPSHAGARDWLGRLYEAEGKPGEAAEQYRAALQLDPGRKDTKARLAKLDKRSQ